VTDVVGTIFKVWIECCKYAVPARLEYGADGIGLA
jgi:hypothetical protein